MSTGSATPQPGPVITSQQLAELFQQHTPRLVQSLLSEIRCHADIDDIISDAFTSLIKKPPSFDINAPEAFLLGVVNKKKLDFFRRKKQKKEFLRGAAPLGADGVGDLPHQEPGAVEILQNRESNSASDIKDTRIYSMVFERLKERDRIVFEWTVTHSETELKKDLAARLGVKPSEISNIEKRIIRHLREAWHDLYEERLPIKERVHGNTGKKRERSHE